MRKEILEDIGEKELINRLAKFMPKNQVLDDCALIKTKNDNLLVNTDSLVENIHFNDISISPQDLGWKAVVSNISDLLSSGSKKTIGITISLILPTKTEWVWVEELYKGINKALKEYGGIILEGIAQWEMRKFSQLQPSVFKANLNFVETHVNQVILS